MNNPNCPTQCLKAAHSFLLYTQKAIDRIGLRRGTITAVVYRGHVVRVDLLTNGRMTSPGNHNNNHARYSLDQMELILRCRLGRLLKHCRLQFGRVQIAVRDGRIREIEFVHGYRPNEIEQLAAQFVN